MKKLSHAAELKINFVLQTATTSVCDASAVTCQLYDMAVGNIEHQLSAARRWVPVCRLRLTARIALSTRLLCSRRQSKSIISFFQPLTLSPPIPSRLYTVPYWSNTPFLIFDVRALWRSVLSARAPERQKLKMVGGLDQYGAGPSNSSNLEQLALKGLKV